MSARTPEELRFIAIRAYQRSIARYERDLREYSRTGDPAIAHRAIVNQLIADDCRRLNALHSAA